MIKQIADKFEGILLDYKPISEYKISDSIIALIKKDANEYISIPYPTLMATDYMRLVRNGDRAKFEELYFLRRHKLTALTAAYHTGVYDNLDEIINGIWALCEESSWCLPAHNTYIRDSAQIILPDNNKPVMDLFACETGAALSMIYYLLKDRLDEVSPLICQRIYDEVHKRIILPYTSSHFWWMGNGDEPMCNWTVWCIQNCLLCTFLLPICNDERQIIFDKACYGIDCFLKDYGEDGCCEEGAQYFRHAGLCLFGCLDILNSITNNAFIDVFNNNKIKNIAEYIVNVHIGGKYYVNFADCSPLAGSCGVREYLFGKSCELSSLIALSVHDFKQGLKEETLFNDESVKLNLYYRMQTIYYSDIILNDCADTLNSANDVYYESVGVCVLRSQSFTLAVKAGNNDDSHNHNDTGSIILYKNLDPIFIDVGPMTYSQKTFSKDRYEIWTMQSGYHNLPTIDGLDQAAGKDYKATDVTVSLEPNKYISMNIKEAYPLNTDLNYQRSVELNSDTSEVYLTDIMSIQPSMLDNGVIINFISYHRPIAEANDNSMLIGSARITYSGASLMQIDTIAIDDARLKKSWSHDVYRIRLKMTSKEFKITIK